METTILGLVIYMCIYIYIYPSNSAKAPVSSTGERPCSTELGRKLPHGFQRRAGRVFWRVKGLMKSIWDMVMHGRLGDICPSKHQVLIALFV